MLTFCYDKFENGAPTATIKLLHLAQMTLMKRPWSNSECKGIHSAISNSQILFHLEYTASLFAMCDITAEMKVQPL